MTAAARPLTRILLLMVCTLAACASPDGIAPGARTVAPASIGLQADATLTWPGEQWWRQYRDPILETLVDRALSDNPTVAVAAARVARAQSAAELAQANSQPRVTGAVDSTRQRFTENGLVPGALAGSVATSNALLINASWEIDLFGRNRAALDAALGAERAAEADLQAARVLLAAQVVRGWFELGRLSEQRALTLLLLAQQERTVALVRARAEAGLDSRRELRAAEAGPPEARRQLAALDERVAVTRHALAALTLQPPSALAQATATLPAATHSALPARIPADLLGRRSDIVAARWRVESALRERDLAAAQFYPNLNLAAFVGFSSLGMSRWFESGSGVLGVGPALRLPIFDAGRLRANLRGRTAEIDIAIEQYNTAVAEGVRDVADHVAALKFLAVQAAEQAATQRASEDAHTLARERHRAGLDNALVMLRAEASVLAQQASAVDIRARILDLDAGLARALGGGVPLQAPEAR